MDLRERTANDRRHPWELVRGHFFRNVAADHADLAACRRVLDIGAGDGWFAGELTKDLPDGGEVVCWDINYSTEDLAVQPPQRLVLTADPPTGTFDLITVLDVLEHIEDDAAFLTGEILPRLHDDSLLIVSVPAYQHLFCAHDEALGHVRRYRPAALRRLLVEHLEIIERGGLFTSLLAPRAATTLLERLGRTARTDGIGAWNHGAAVSRTVLGALSSDAAVCRWASLRGIIVPGLSTWAVCRPRLSTGHHG